MAPLSLHMFLGSTCLMGRGYSKRVFYAAFALPLPSLVGFGGILAHPELVIDTALSLEVSVHSPALLPS